MLIDSSFDVFDSFFFTVAKNFGREGYKQNNVRVTHDD